jgi:hypothetical protein
MSRAWGSNITILLDGSGNRDLEVASAGTALWIGYGVLQSDPVIMAANGVSFALVATLLFFKIHGAASST